VFLKFKISNNFKQTIDEKHSKQPNIQSVGKSIPAYGFKNLKKKISEPKVSRLLPNVCNFQKENNIIGYGFKNL
jgi:hypothetical protein